MHRESLAIKYLATDFHNEPQKAYTHTSDEVSDVQRKLLAERATWTVLGAGWEGKVFAHNDSVIKTFTPGRSPFRNCAPGDTSDKWPTEIAASIRFGGISGDTKSNSTEYAGLEGFLPVETYFKASVSPSKPAEWHLVTPLLKGGNLNIFAKRVTQDPRITTFQELDAQYRPAFEGLLISIQHLHEEGYCHDDIKPANIFVRDENHWVVGDLGNVRQTTHPYHSSRLWLDNGQLADCCANDVMRALKSYLKFLQLAASNKDEFNEAFFESKEPSSKLFWRASAEAPNMNAAQLLRLSHFENPRQSSTTRIGDRLATPTVPFSLLSIFFPDFALQRAVDHVLQTRMGEKLARWWAMVAVLGVPVIESCGV